MLRETPFLITHNSKSVMAGQQSVPTGSGRVSFTQAFRLVEHALPGNNDMTGLQCSFQRKCEIKFFFLKKERNKLH